MRLPPPRNDDVWTVLRDHDIEELWDPSRAPHLATAHRTRTTLLMSIVRELCPPGSRVFDVGCAQGTLGLLLAEEGYRVTLNDIRAVALEYARARMERGDVSFCAGRLAEAVPAEPVHDVAFCTEVLEHVRRPGLLLSQIADRLRPGGHLIVTTPNADYFLSRLPSFGRANQATIDNAEPDSMDGGAHRYLFTSEELAALVRACGFAIARTGFFLPFWVQGHLKTRYVHRLLFSARGRIVEATAARISRASRRLCASQYLVARWPPSAAGDP